MRLYFVGGIHGSGKTTLCRNLAAKLRAPHHSAGELIRLGGESQEVRDKTVRDVKKNQTLLLSALNDLRNAGTATVILDGHYTVVDSTGAICPVEIEVFHALNPSSLVLVDSEPELVVKRLRERDNRDYSLTFVEHHAREEKAHAETISRTLQIPLLLLSAYATADALASQLVSPNAIHYGVS
ncbi:ATP-binding protein [Longimicrobium terrae]|uniref:Adenylate kinase n=1 Tax=Longimicrobium terrae TaxID=1639882 RepID=A0A841GQ92_9BACT|nr:ATP-binding protein [Longimicrobium terrae]MBB4635218.1 adenylate kinase [Longimicrobium terrae]MBB6069612.1 adenylate kinase [Longimicrobium terrae]NNC31587.1 AAA family ATPase [Longimicrobium terrae]